MTPVVRFDFDSKTYNMTQYGTENFSKVALINLYNCLYLIANTLRLVILPNLFKTAFALDNANAIIVLLSVWFFNMVGKVFLNIIYFTMFIIISKKRLAIRNNSNWCKWALLIETVKTIFNHWKNVYWFYLLLWHMLWLMSVFFSIIKSFVSVEYGEQR